LAGFHALLNYWMMHISGVFEHFPAFWPLLTNLFSSNPFNPTLLNVLGTIPPAHHLHILKIFHPP
jgi:hypothetical protein